MSVVVFAKIRFEFPFLHHYAKMQCFDEQAYTHELENKVSRLEEENERLKRQKVSSILVLVLLPVI